MMFLFQQMVLVVLHIFTNEYTTQNLVRDLQVKIRILVLQLIVIKWQLSVTPKKLADRGVFPFENGGKMWVFLPFYLSFLAQKHILF